MSQDIRILKKQAEINCCANFHKQIWTKKGIDYFNALCVLFYVVLEVVVLSVRFLMCSMRTAWLLQNFEINFQRFT